MSILGLVLTIQALGQLGALIKGNREKGVEFLSFMLYQTCICVHKKIVY